MPAGRPSEYDPAIAADICTLISTTTLGLRDICDSQDKFPDQNTFYRWMLSHAELRELYARAKESQMEALAEEIFEIADDKPIATITFGENGVKTCVDAAGVQRNRLRVDTRKWVMSKLAPKKYGEKLRAQRPGWRSDSR